MELPNNANPNISTEESTININSTEEVNAIAIVSQFQGIFYSHCNNMRQWICWLMTYCELCSY